MFARRVLLRNLPASHEAFDQRGQSSSCLCTFIFRMVHLEQRNIPPYRLFTVYSCENTHCR